METSNTIEDMRKQWNALSDEEKKIQNAQRELRNRQRRRQEWLNKQKQFVVALLVFLFGPMLLSVGLLKLLFIGSHVTEGAFQFLAWILLIAIWYAEHKLLHITRWFECYCKRHPFYC